MTQRCSRIARAASESTSPGTMSRAQRAKRPRAEVINPGAGEAAHGACDQGRRTLPRSHDPALDPSGCSPGGRPSAPMARRWWIWLTTKSGATIVDVHAAAQQLDAQGLARRSPRAHGLLAALTVRSCTLAESGDARHGTSASARPSGARQRRGGSCTLPRTFTLQSCSYTWKVSDRIEARPHRHAGVVDEHVQAPEARHRPGHAVQAVLGLCEIIGGHRLHPRAEHGAGRGGLLQDAFTLCAASTRSASSAASVSASGAPDALEALMRTRPCR